VKAKHSRILRRRKREIERRTDRTNFPSHDGPVFAASNVHYEMADRWRAIECGALGAFHLLARNTGLVDALDANLSLLKLHMPYCESDHVLNIAYNTLTGGTCLEDLELRRNNEAYLDALGAARIPDPTTAGDFTRRFSPASVLSLMEAINSIRPGLWKENLPRHERALAVIDADGTMAPTTGECKEGMGLNHKGQWGYHPLLVSLANTQEVLYLVNRPGNRPSHEGAPEWLDRSADLVGQAFAKVCFRGDTDFALTANFDRWDAAGRWFVFGMDAMSNAVQIAESLPTTAWEALKRSPRHKGTDHARHRRANVKQAIVEERGYKNIELHCEHVAQFEYRPTKCKKTYRVVVLRKDLSVKKGQQLLFDDMRYFFYITNRTDLTPQGVVHFANERCNQENLIDRQRAVQPGEPDRSAQERDERAAHAHGRSGVELGVHGDGVAGLDAEGVVRACGAAQDVAGGTAGHGVQAVRALDRARAVPDRQDGSSDCVSFPRVHRMAANVLRHVRPDSPPAHGVGAGPRQFQQRSNAPWVCRCVGVGAVRPNTGRQSAPALRSQRGKRPQ